MFFHSQIECIQYASYQSHDMLIHEQGPFLFMTRSRHAHELRLSKHTNAINLVPAILGSNRIAKRTTCKATTPSTSPNPTKTTTSSSTSAATSTTTAFPLESIRSTLCSLLKHLFIALDEIGCLVREGKSECLETRQINALAEDNGAADLVECGGEVFARNHLGNDGGDLAFGEIEHGGERGEEDSLV